MSDNQFAKFAVINLPKTKADSIVPKYSITVLEWTQTNDKLPDVETPVLIVMNGKVRIGELRWEHPSWEETFESFMYWDDPNNDGQDWERYNVTHWMPIPEIPS